MFHYDYIAAKAIYVARWPLGIKGALASIEGNVSSLDFWPLIMHMSTLKGEPFFWGKGHYLLLPCWRRHVEATMFTVEADPDRHKERERMLIILTLTPFLCASSGYEQVLHRTLTVQAAAAALACVRRACSCRWSVLVCSHCCFFYSTRWLPRRVSEWGRGRRLRLASYAGLIHRGRWRTLATVSSVSQ